MIAVTHLEVQYSIIMSVGFQSVQSNLLVHAACQAKYTMVLYMPKYCAIKRKKLLLLHAACWVLRKAYCNTINAGVLRCKCLLGIYKKTGKCVLKGS